MLVLYKSMHKPSKSVLDTSKGGTEAGRGGRGGGRTVLVRTPFMLLWLWMGQFIGLAVSSRLALGEAGRVLRVVRGVGEGELTEPAL